MTDVALESLAEKEIVSSLGPADHIGPLIFNKFFMFRRFP
jgi:hypothetical protein